MAFLAQFVKQYDAGGRAQFVEQYLDTSTTMVASADDFDSAIGTTSVTNASTATPDVTITPFNPAEVSGWMMTYTRYTGCSGKTPEFSLDFTSYRGGIALPASPWQMVWRYVDDTDPGTGMPRAWNTFDNNAGDPSHVFSNNSAFTQDAVEVAVKPRWRYLDTQHAVAYCAAHTFGSELPSAVAFGGAANVFNTVTLTSGADNSAPPTTLNQYGVLLDDTASQPAGGEDKLNIIMLMAQHSSEDQGSYVGWQMMMFYLDGTGTLADWFRKHCRLYFYDPNPAGRYYGAERWTQEQASDEDANRQWGGAVSGSSEQVDAVEAAIALDITRADVMLDFHGDYRLNGNGLADNFGDFIYNNTAGNNWQTRLEASSTRTYRDLGNAGAGWAAFYAVEDLGAQLGVVAEYPIAFTGYPSASSMYGGNIDDMVTTLQEMVTAEELVLTGSAIIDADSGSFSLTGGEVLLTAQRQLSGNPGTLSLTGSDATLTYAPVASSQLDADPGTFTFTGGTVNLSYSGEAKVFSINGIQIT